MSLFDLSFVVSALSTGSVTVTRYNPTSYTDGRADARTVASTTTARGSIQPISGADLRRLPEASRYGDVKSIWVSAQVLKGDELEIDGARYQVEHIADWDAAGNYTKTVARRLDSREL